MKNLKKTLSVILVAILLISAVPMQSFAAFDWIWPKVVKVEFVNNVPLSNKHIQNLDSWYGTSDAYVYDVSTEKQIYKLYFSNGRTVEIDNNELYGTDLLSGVLYAGTVVHVNREECAKAIAEGKNTVNVSISVVVYYVNDNFKIYSFEMEKEIVDEIVKSVELIDAMPESFDTSYPEKSFVGKKFEIEYGDGNKEVLEFEFMGDNGYYLGNEPVYMWYGEDKYIDETTGETVYFEGIQFDYIDEFVVLDKKLIPCPYSSVEITDYKLDSSVAGITELTYKLTYKDDRVVEKTLTFDKALTYAESKVIDTVDGNDINLYVEAWADSYCIELGIGNYIWEITDYVEGDLVNFCDCRCHKNELLNIIVHTLICKVWEIFRINEYCKCGDWHW